MWSSPSPSSTPDGWLRLVRAGDSGRRPHFGLHQWISRRGQLDRHGRVDAGALTKRGGDLGGVLELHRRIRVWDRDRQDDRERTDRPQRGRFDRRAWWTAGGNHLGPGYLVAGPADVVLARPHWRLRRRGRRQVRVLRNHRRWLDQDAHLHRGRAGHGVHAGAATHRGVVVVLAPIVATTSGQVIPSAAARVGGTLLTRPWDERRAEDDGDYRRTVGIEPGAVRELSNPALSPHRRRAHSAVGHRGRGPRNRTGDDGGRLADREDDGPAHHEAHPVRGLLRRDSGSNHALRLLALRHPREYDAHDHRRDHGRRRSTALLCRAL